MENEQHFEQKIDNDLVELNDSLGQEIVEGQIKSTERELGDFEKALANKQAEKARYIEQAAGHKRAREIVLKNFVKLPSSFTWEYEKDPEYWAIQRQMAEWKFAAEDKVDEGTIARIDYDIAAMTEQIEQCKIKLTKLLKKD